MWHYFVFLVPWYREQYWEVLYFITYGRLGKQEAYITKLNSQHQDKGTYMYPDLYLQCFHCENQMGVLSLIPIQQKDQNETCVSILHLAIYSVLTVQYFNSDNRYFYWDNQQHSQSKKYMLFYCHTPKPNERLQFKIIWKITEFIFLIYMYIYTHTYTHLILKLNYSGKEN